MALPLPGHQPFNNRPATVPKQRVERSPTAGEDHRKNGGNPRATSYSEPGDDGQFIDVVVGQREGEIKACSVAMAHLQRQDRFCRRR